jgi:hypothetical protein
MEALQEAAQQAERAEADPEPEALPDEAEAQQEAVGTKRKRGSAHEVAEKRVVDVRLRLQAAQARLEKHKSNPNPNARVREQITKEEASVRKFVGQLDVAKEALTQAKLKAATAQAKAAAQAKQAQEREEHTRAFSDAGAILLCELRYGKYRARFENTSDTVDSIWPHIAKDIDAAVERGDLPRTDSRSAQALQKRLSTEVGEFRLWCATAQRAIVSGAPRDRLEECVTAHRRATTTILRKLGVCRLPMSVPEWHIEGDATESATNGHGNALVEPTPPPPPPVHPWTFGVERSGEAWDGEEWDADDPEMEEPEEEGEEVERRGGSGGGGGGATPTPRGTGGATPSSTSTASGTPSTSASASGRGGESSGVKTELKPLHIGGAHGGSGGKGKQSAVATALDNFARVRPFLPPSLPPYLMCVRPTPLCRLTPRARRTQSRRRRIYR